MLRTRSRTRGGARLNPFATASFFAPLTSSLGLSKGTGVATFTRATTATVMGFAPGALPGDAQVLLSVAAGEARFSGARRISAGVWSDYYADGTLIPANLRLGYLSEVAATNLFLNSAVGVTQTTPALTAASYTLSFKGTGSIVATGGFVGTLTGTGASNRVSLTATATAAAAVLTVTGSITEVMLNLGALSSYIPTAGTAVARDADVDSYPTAGNIGTSGAVYLEFTRSGAGTAVLWSTFTDASNFVAIYIDPTYALIRKRVAGVNYDSSIAFTFISGNTYKLAARFGAGGQQISVSGVLGTANTNLSNAVIAGTMHVGSYNSALQPTANIHNAGCWTPPLTDAQLQNVTT